MAEQYGSANLVSGGSRQISDAEEALIGKILQEFGQYQVWRNTTAAHCEEIAELILPSSRNTFFFGNFNWPGQKKTQQQVDATGMMALERFCAIADSMVTPRNMQWHGLQGDDYVMKDRRSREWFDQVTELLFKHRYAAHANFAAQNYSNWVSLGAFGNATMYIDKFDNRWNGGDAGLRYRSVPFGETFFGENHQGKVDRMIRWFRLTAYQAAQKWGYDALPENLRVAIDQRSLWPYNFLHCVWPREDHDPRALDHRRMPFASYFVSFEGRCLMEPERGYYNFPFATSRYDQTPGEVYGRGPAHRVLPSLKTLNAEKTTFLKQGHRAADPVLLMNDDGIMSMDLRPGAKNPGGVTSDGKPLVHILPTGNIQISEKMMEAEAKIIDNGFMTSIFDALIENGNMKATQVVELVNERGMLIAPTLGRQFNEFIGGLVPRELQLLAELRLLPPMPPRLREAHGAYEVTDTSPLARSARLNEAVGFNRWVDTLRETAIATNDPSWLDIVSKERSGPDLADIMNVRSRWVATPDELAAKAQQRAKAAQNENDIKSLPGRAAIMNAQTKANAAAPAQQQPQQPAQ